jgi:hypothetical protein
MPHPRGSSGGQVGVGIALVLLNVTFAVVVEAEEICVEAMAPVRTRTATKERTMSFMGILRKL